MLTESQRKQVAYLILLHLGMTPSPATVQALIGLEPARTAPAGANAYQIAVWLLDYTLNLPQPDLFIQVVTAVDAQGELLEVQELLLRLRQDASIWQTHALDELWIPQQWPFADRSELRRVLFAMSQDAGPTAITIEAPQGHGKRTMCAYIERLASKQGSFRPVVVHLRREPSPGVLNALVADLRIGLELELREPGLGDGTTHVEAERRALVSALTLAQELAGDALFAPSAAWLIANVIDGAGVEPGVLRFLDELLGQVQETPRRVAPSPHSSAFRRRGWTRAGAPAGPPGPLCAARGRQGRDHAVAGGGRARQAAPALLRRDIQGARHGEPDAGAALGTACMAGTALRIGSPHPG
jgi:hypothetical protein